MNGDANNQSRTTDLGAVRINNDAITTIASIAASEVRGVRSMGGGFKKSFCDLLHGRAKYKGVRIDSREGDIKLIVSIIVDYGVDIPRIADEVQERVKHAVEKMTGLVLSEVNVIIEGVAQKPGIQDKL